jgi:hypothetical protein
MDLRPPDRLNEEGAFTWSDEAHVTFEKLKKVMSTCLVLSLPDFSQPFILECDASGARVGAVLMQNRHPIAYGSRKLRGPELLYTIYDKEMLAIMHALSKFRQYLVGAKFVVGTDHDSLEYFLSQKDLNERQQKWVSKSQAYNFESPTICTASTLSIPGHPLQKCIPPFCGCIYCKQLRRIAKQGPSSL